MAGKRIRIKGQVITTSPNTGIPIPLYKAGTDTLVSVGANDYVSIDSVQVTSAAGSNTVAFQDAAGAPDPESIFFHVITIATASQKFRHPVVGALGKTVYVHGSGANKIGVVVTGWLHQG